MYEAKQIPYMLDANFTDAIIYQETKLKELSSVCMCIWEMKSKHQIDRVITNQILPDACINIIFDFVNRQICFAGYSKQTESFPLYQEIDYMGVRLKPGAFYALCHIDADQMVDQIIPFSKIDTSFCLDAVFSCKDSLMRIDQIQAYLMQKMTAMPELKLDFIHLVDELYQSPKDQNVIIMAEKLGYTKRQLLRIFHKHYGISPKVLLNILRLHLCLSILQRKTMNLAEIAAQCGFYDQSHFIKEIKRYTGFSPLKLMEYD